MIGINLRATPEQDDFTARWLQRLGAATRQVRSRHVDSEAGGTTMMRSRCVKSVGLLLQPWSSGLLLLCLLIPVRGNAAPICLQTQALGPQCIYYDAAECRKEAGRQGGICSANPKEVRVSPNVGQYCLLTSEHVSLCVYSDRTSCDRDAARQGAVCAYSTGVAPSGAPDPYARIEGR